MFTEKGGGVWPFENTFGSRLRQLGKWGAVLRGKESPSFLDSRAYPNAEEEVPRRIKASERFMWGGGPKHADPIILPVTTTDPDTESFPCQVGSARKGESFEVHYLWPLGTSW